jgi:hypothetical protein
MKTIRLLWSIAAATLVLQAQDQKVPDQKVMDKIIEIRYANANAVANAISMFVGGNVRGDTSLHAISVRGTAESIAKVEEAVKKLDVPPSNIELTVYLVSGSADSKQARADDIPAELTSTVKQLRGLFQYKSYRILESFALRARDGHDASTSGSLAGSGATYEFHYKSASVSSGTPRVVHMDGMQLEVRTPITNNLVTNRDKDGHIVYDRSTIYTNIDAGEGQKIVVGKSTFHGSDDALILIVTAKVVE